MQKEHAKLEEFNQEIEHLNKEHKRITEELTEANLEAQKLTHEIEKFQKEQNNSEQILRDLETHHDWITDQKG